VAANVQPKAHERLEMAGCCRRLVGPPDRSNFTRQIAASKPN
jgi:hypothetical protein